MKLPIAKEKKEKKEKRKKERKKEKKKERREERKKERKEKRKLKSKQASKYPSCAISDCSETASPGFDLIGGGCCWRDGDGDGDGDGWERLDRFRLCMACRWGFVVSFFGWLHGWMGRLNGWDS